MITVCDRNRRWGRRKREVKPKHLCSPPGLTLCFLPVYLHIFWCWYTTRISYFCRSSHMTFSHIASVLLCSIIETMYLWPDSVPLCNYREYYAGAFVSLSSCLHCEQAWKQIIKSSSGGTRDRVISLFFAPVIGFLKELL